MLRILNFLSLTQPLLYALLLLAIIALFSSGCATAGADSAGRTRDFTTTATTTAAGAYIGSKEGDGKAKNAAVGAAIGFVAGESINYFNNKHSVRRFLLATKRGSPTP